VTRLRDVVAALDELYPAAWAESWDAGGLVVGDPDAVVRRVLFAIDPVTPVVAEAAERGADLLVSHHPLYLRGTTTVAATDPKGRVVHRLIAGGCGLFVAHTNADVAAPGVSDALAARLGLAPGALDTALRRLRGRYRQRIEAGLALCSPTAQGRADLRRQLHAALVDLEVMR
jgi:putative NIF3 family GTP cyclohydrolase 1 type 2